MPGLRRARLHEHIAMGTTLYGVYTRFPFWRPSSTQVGCWPKAIALLPSALQLTTNPLSGVGTAQTRYSRGHRSILSLQIR